MQAPTASHNEEPKGPPAGMGTELPHCHTGPMGQLSGLSSAH